MPRHIFICHIDKLKKVSHKVMLKGKYLLFPFTTINRRINRLDIKIKDIDDSMKFKDEYIVIAIDSTGIKVTNRGLNGYEKNGI
jgi:hypothetical protein